MNLSRTRTWGPFQVSSVAPLCERCVPRELEVGYISKSSTTRALEFRERREFSLRHRRHGVSAERR